MIFDVQSKDHLQQASDAGIFGVQDGKVTLEQAGEVYYGTLSGDCQSISWSDGDTWDLEEGACLSKASPCYDPKVKCEIPKGSSIQIDGKDINIAAAIEQNAASASVAPARPG